MALEGIFILNPAHEEFFSVNMARQLEMLPTPVLECGISFVCKRWLKIVKW